MCLQPFYYFHYHSNTNFHVIVKTNDTCIISTLPSVHISSFIELAISGSRFQWTDEQTDVQMDGKPVVPSGVNIYYICSY